MAPLNTKERLLLVFLFLLIIGTLILDVSFALRSRLLIFLSSVWVGFFATMLVFDFVQHYFRTPYDHYEVFVPTPKELVFEKLRLADVKENDTVYDLGSGDGRVLIIAARDFGAKSVGIEIRKDLAGESKERIREAGLSHKAKVIRSNFMKTGISDADVIVLYLSSGTLHELFPKLQRELKKGTRIITHDFSIPEWTPTREVDWQGADGKGAKIYVYIQD